MDEVKRFYLILGLALLTLFMVARPRTFEEVMPGFYDGPIVKCEAGYFAGAEVGEGVSYTTLIKEFEVGSEDYDELMELITSARYGRKLTDALFGGAGGYSTPRPYARITFYQQDAVYEYSLFNRHLLAGLSHDERDYRPSGGRSFQTEAIEFIRTHGETVDTQVKQY